MALVSFGYRVDMSAIDPPMEVGAYIVAYDLDGFLKQKDHLGVITLVGSGAGGPQGPPGPVGPAGLTWSGPWIATQSYSQNYAVGYGSASWWCISNVTGATSNLSPDLDSTHWALLAAQGSPGSQGAQGFLGPQGAQGAIGLNWLGDWIPNVYDLRDAVYYDGSSYVCIASTVGTEPITPDSNSACWKLLASKGDTGLQGPIGATGLGGSQDIFYNLGGTVSATNSTTGIYRTGSLNIGTGTASDSRFVVSSSGGTVSLIVDENGSIYNGDLTNLRFGYNALSGTFSGSFNLAMGNFTSTKYNQTLSYYYDIENGSGYTDGTYSVTTFLYSGEPLIEYPVVLVEVVGGICTTIDVLSIGSGYINGGYDTILTANLPGGSGYQVSVIVDDTSYNLAIGYASLQNNQSYGNLGIGMQTLQQNKTGCYNIAIGVSSLWSNDSGCYNIAIGVSSLWSNTSGGQNTAIGIVSLYSNTTGSWNNSIGYQSLFCNTTGYYNTGVGNESLYYNSVGYSNVGIGTRALYSNRTGYSNVAIGDYALAAYAYAGQGISNNNVAIGSGSLGYNIYGNRNIAIGSEAGSAVANYVDYGRNLSGSASIFIGTNTKPNSASESNQIVIGDSAIGNGSNSVTLGNNNITKTILKGNVGIGLTGPSTKLHIYATQSGAFRLQDGTQASGYVLTSDASGVGTWTASSKNNFATSSFYIKGGTVSAYDTTSAIYRTGALLIGTGSVNSNDRFVVSSSTGSVSFVVDNSGSIYNSDSRFNTKFGYQILLSNTGFYNTAIGFWSLYSNTTGQSNTTLGYQSLYSNTTGQQNTAIGLQSLVSNTTGQQNTAIGLNSLYSNTTGVYNTAIGVNSLFSNTTSYFNVAVGYSSLYSNTSGVNSFGTITGGSGYVTGTYSNVQLTYLSGSTATTYPTATITVGAGGTVSSVTLVTRGAGFKDTTTVMSVAPSSVGGTGSSFSITVSSLRTGDGTAIGNSALYSNTTGGSNVAIGNSALYYNTTGNSNIAIGESSLRLNTTGYANTTLGASSLQYNTTGLNNTAVGYSSLYSNTIGQENTALGYASLYSNTTGYRNTVIGSNALGPNTVGIDNIAIGNNSGQYPIAGGFGVTGSNRSIFIGVDTRPELNNQINQIVIGHQAYGNGSNTVTLGNDSVLRTYLKGSVVIADGTQGNNYVLTSNSSGVASWSASISVNQVSANQLNLFDSASGDYKSIICNDSIFSFRDASNTPVFRIENGDIRLHNSDYDVEATISPSLITNYQVYNLPDESGTLAIRNYKVYTALVSQSGSSATYSISEGELTIGVTYRIDDNSDGLDVTNVGAPDNDLGTYFVATGVDPNYWGTGLLSYNPGTPVVTVLENTIGNVWFKYVNVGTYTINLPYIVAADKVFSICGQVESGGDAFFSKMGLIGYDGITGLPSVLLYSLAYDLTDVELDTEGPLSIEIRVYD